MAKFKYIALDKEGRELSGVIESTSENRARKDLAAQGFSVSRIAEVAAIASEKKAAGGKAKKPLFGTGVGKENITVFSRPAFHPAESRDSRLLRSLEVIARQEKNPYFKAIVDQLADNVRTGNKFSDGLSQHPKIFDKLYVNMAKAGEARRRPRRRSRQALDFPGKGAQNHQQSQERDGLPDSHHGRRHSYRGNPNDIRRSAIPKDFYGYAERQREDAALTQTIIDISDFMKENYILTGLIIVGVILFVKIFFKTKIGIRVWDTAAIKLPKIGDLVMKSTVARFTRTFGTLLAIRRTDTRGAHHHPRNHQQLADFRRAFARARRRARRRKPLNAPRPAENLPDNGHEHG